MYKATLLLLCAIIAMVYSDLTPEMRQHLFEVQNECMEESGATDEMVMNAYAGTFTDAPELAEHLICCGKRHGIMDDAGHLHKEIFKPKLLMVIDDEAKVDAVLDKCLIERGNAQETAIGSAKCMFRELHM